MKEDAAWRNWA